MGLVTGIACLGEGCRFCGDTGRMDWEEEYDTYDGLQAVSYMYELFNQLLERDLLQRRHYWEGLHAMGGLAGRLMNEWSETDAVIWNALRGIMPADEADAQ